MDLVLSESDREIVRSLRENHRVLMDVNDTNCLDVRNGIIHIGCPDGDQLMDILGRSVRMFEQQQVTPRIHPPSLHGGAILIPEESPLNSAEYPHDRILMKHIRDAARMKDMTVVALYAHAPCGAATECGLTVLDEIDLLMAAKRRVKTAHPELKVACFFHVDKGGGNKRTYFVSRAAWERYVAAELVSRRNDEQPVAVSV